MVALAKNQIVVYSKMGQIHDSNRKKPFFFSYLVMIHTSHKGDPIMMKDDDDMML
jgi:hypothetical protein